MSRQLILLSVFFWSVIAYANSPTVKLMPLDFSLHNKLPTPSTPWYGWQLFSWKNWIMRSSSGPLLLPLPTNHPPLSVFEARFAAVVDQPVSRFSANYLHNIATVKKLDPDDIQTQLPMKDPKGEPAPFVVETVVPFPARWSALITVGKAANILSAKSSGQLIMVSVFDYISHDQILSDPKIQEFVKRLDVTGRIPYAINRQGIVNINEIGEFGSMVTFFYPVTANKTLIVSDFALGLKNKILKLGFHAGDLNFTGESVLLGTNPALNTSSGIGAGLPQYTEELFLNTWRGFNFK